MRDRIWIAPSLLSADFSCIKNEIIRLEKVVDAWHIDVMDGHFVPNITLGPFIVKAISRITSKPLDVHLMISDPLKYADAFLDAGADFLTAHIEAFQDRKEVLTFLSQVRSRKAKVGISLRPSTDPSVLDPFLSDLDLVLVMTVEPGFGGQRFMEDQVPKITYFASRFGGLLAVDGGINEQTASLVLNAGANFLIAGSYIFGSKDPIQQVRKLREVMRR